MSPPSSVRLLRIAGRAQGGYDHRASMDGPSDAELARLARDRDSRAATLVWDRYSGVVRAVLFRSVGPSHDVEDLVQDVFIGFFKNVGTLRDPSSLRAFLVGIAVRTAHSALRKKRVRRWLHLSDDGTVPEVPSHDSDPRTREALRRLYSILDELPDRERLAFVLRYAEGHELTEAAAALDVSLATVKRMLQRAEAHVQKRAKDDDLLSDWTGGDDE
ncbi:MAG TPA: sigma-70 family RNA polymerase sigma factor [Polyangiaceae bacterium]